ncbi:MAG TPA: non-homologous end-joining DNA ligase, partial [Candidatus Binatia bacterium]|nr:non-homologous end-joining DNA ligase [Candidatus Binatia bacterium]
PAGDEWLHETKYDGYRILCRLQRGRAVLSSRNGKDWTDRFRIVADAAVALPARAVLLDGEVAAVGRDGVTSFGALQRGADGDARLVYFVFDLLHADGMDLTGVALEARKDALRTIIGDAQGTLRYSDHVIGGGEACFRRACRAHLEGIISKRRDAPYVGGRGRTWLKTKCVQGQELVVGGFTDPEGTRVGLGALLLGVHDVDGRLRYAGKVGTGFGHAEAVALRARMDALTTNVNPFVERPPGATRVHWVRPVTVVEVGFTEWTTDGRLRHPTFRGLREDKAASTITRDAPSRRTP